MREQNNFDAIRLIAAISVLFTHAFLIAEGSQQNEPVVRLTGYQCPLGLLGVFVFFTISGYLVTRSRLATPTAGRFMLKRACRIFPGLLVNLLVAALVLGPLVTTLPFEAYITDRRVYAYLGHNALLELGDYPLPGVVFADNPVGDVVNGSLWTLRYEVMMYLMLVGLGWLRLLNLRVSLTLLGLGIAALFFEKSLDPLGDVGEWLWMLSFFAIGMVLHFLDARRVLRWPVALAAAAGLVASLYVHHLILLFSIFGGTLAIWAGLCYTPALQALSRFGDLSYGVYIYGWPAGQWVEHASGGKAAWWQVFLGSLALSLGLALLSWHGIEKRAIRFGRRWRLSRPYQSAVPTSADAG